jgi:regulatory protein YycH of two-component signal transduction system YycFG
MRELEIQRAPINFLLLDAELRQAIPSVYVGLSRRQDVLVVHVQESVTLEQIGLVQHIVAQHNPAQLTPQQQREQQLHNLRQAQTALDTAEFVTESAAIQTLAAKIAWLEAEIRQLRGL